jgi:hypothetical protein
MKIARMKHGDELNGLVEEDTPTLDGRRVTRGR